jgi:hypothetical protein
VHELNAQFGGVAKWPKATVCKTVIRGFDSHRRLLHFQVRITAGREACALDAPGRYGAVYSILLNGIVPLTTLQNGLPSLTPTVP